MPVSVQESSASLAEAETACAGGPRYRGWACWQKSSRKDPADLGVEPDRLLDSPTLRTAFRSARLYNRAWTALPEAPFARPVAVSSVGGGCPYATLKAGWKVAEEFPVNRGGRRGIGPPKANGAVLAAPDRGPPAAAWCCGSVPAPIRRDRTSTGGWRASFLELVPVIVDVRAAGAEFVTARRGAARIGSSNPR